MNRSGVVSTTLRGSYVLSLALLAMPATAHAFRLGAELSGGYSQSEQCRPGVGATSNLRVFPGSCAPSTDFAGAAQFQLTLIGYHPLGEHVQVGFRAGVLLNALAPSVTRIVEETPQGSGPETTVTTPGSVAPGVPLDVGLRFPIKTLFIETSGGLWLVGALAAHLGLGVGLQLRRFSFAIEAGWLRRLDGAGAAGPPLPSGRLLLLLRCGFQF